MDRDAVAHDAVANEVAGLLRTDPPSADEDDR